MIFTVGHSTLPPDGFLELLGRDSITLLWDVRSYPSSRQEWFRRERLEEWLPAAGITYVWVPALGGRRKAPPGGAPPRKAAGEDRGWRQQGFANYQWHMTTPEFLEAADELARLGRRRDLAVMCAEGVWWRCHRAMIADYLTTAGVEVVHLQPRRLEHASVVADRLERYHAEVLTAWRRHREGSPQGGRAQAPGRTAA